VELEQLQSGFALRFGYHQVDEEVRS
jgi:hypothetical protein